VLAGPAAIEDSLPSAGCIALLLAIVIASYRQTVRAYPGGGGAYNVAHQNLGIGAGLIARCLLHLQRTGTAETVPAVREDAVATDCRPPTRLLDGICAIKCSRSSSFGASALRP
jgi:hypothetical protein